MKMSYFTFGTNNLDAAARFYDALFEGMGLQQVPASERMTYFMGEGFAFALALPFDGDPATNGNGTMFGFDVGSTEDVERLHSRAIELGGTSEGAPGQRGPYFSAYVRDLDRNKLCLFMPAAA
jgi:predicted lactoylglutathione lyase